MPFEITLHPATAHFPIALLSLSSICGLLYIYWRPQAELRTLTWWPMIIGWISGAVSIGSGLLAQANLPIRAPYTRLLNWHIGTALAILLIYGTLLYWRWLRRNQTQSTPDALLAYSTARIWVTILLTSGLLILLLTGWSGGRLVYTWGVNVP